jgi:hypothetical protein
LRDPSAQATSCDSTGHAIIDPPQIHEIGQRRTTPVWFDGIDTIAFICRPAAFDRVCADRSEDSQTVLAANERRGQPTRI